MKRRVLQLLASLSDFEALKNNQAMQEDFIRGVMGIFSSTSENKENQDMCLKMGCVEYMKNFYNDANFRVEAYSHFMGDVIMMCN